MSDELMDPSEWLAAAQAVDVGHKQKVRHLCGDASLVVYNNIDSWTAWCWRCHTKGWVPKPEANMQERLARKAKQKELDDAISYQVRRPFPACFDQASWPVAARVWLYKAGLTPALIRELGAYYHEPTGRVVLPVWDASGATVFWQARNPEYPAGGPKYISSSVPRQSVHISYLPRGASPHGRDVVLTEDILSAFKVGRSGAAEGYAVMGTALGAHTVARLLRAGASSPGDTQGPSVFTWFDPDGAGQRARAEAARSLSLVGIEPIHIVTQHDPKHYALGEIARIINESRSHALADHARPEEVQPATADAKP